MAGWTGIENGLNKELARESSRRRTEACSGRKKMSVVATRLFLLLLLSFRFTFSVLSPLLLAYSYFLRFHLHLDLNSLLSPALLQFRQTFSYSSTAIRRVLIFAPCYSIPPRHVLPPLGHLHLFPFASWPLFYTRFRVKTFPSSFRIGLTLVGNVGSELGVDYAFLGL